MVGVLLITQIFLRPFNRVALGTKILLTTAIVRFKLLALLGPGCGEDRWHYGEARRTLEVKTGIECYCYLLG